MNQEKITMFEEYLKLGISPILLENIPSNVFDDAVVLHSDCDLSLLNGHYEGVEFVPPMWYTELTKQSKNQKPLLIIDGINKIKIEEQAKFVEILKYKKISTFDLPKDCIIIVTCSNLEEFKINEEIYSLIVHI